MAEFLCPHCAGECYRDSVDVGVGTMYGPYGCYSCGWSQDREYDNSAGPSPAQQADPDRYVDPCGVSHSLQRMREAVQRFGLDPAVIDEVFKGDCTLHGAKKEVPRD